METTDRSALEGKMIPELQKIASNLGIEGTQRLRKAGLIDAIVARGDDGPGNGSTQSPALPPAASTEGAVASDNGSQRPDAPSDDRGAASVQREESDAGSGPQSQDPIPARDDSRQGAEQDRDDAPQGLDRGDRSPGRGDRNQNRGDRNQGRGQNQPGGQGGDGQNRDRDARRQRPSREDRRKQREERRLREEQGREDELLTAPTATGLLDILPEGYGFLRTSGYLPGPEDVYVSLSQVRRSMLRKGDMLTGKIRRARDNEKYAALLQIDAINDMDPEAATSRPNYDKLTPLFPDERFRLEHEGSGVAERIIDMVAPIGKGQRGMVVSPPKAGKTTILKQIANGIASSSPETHVIVLLVDERPEEVTDWQRTVQAAEVVYSTFDRPADQHIQVTELVLERSRRLAEMGRDVAILLDSITRLARAYNLAAPASGKILSGGVDSTALYPPKRFFGAARNIEEGGSITIIASALVETGSRMDEVIFEEFKGTGNMELRLDRSLAEKRLFPAINVDASSTRKEELLMPIEELALVVKLRRVLHALEPGAALELLTDKIRATKSNEQFLKEIAKAPAGG
ncbi:MAG: transcription termination factor Rho [Actinobacteria bacterium]|nr:transcription termination factor Rho [Actinomycetota bacterium]